MISSYVLAGLAAERQNAFLAQAEADRLARQARRGSQKSAGARRSLRFWVPRPNGRGTRRVTPARPAA
jgi:hypothetical protein